MNVSDVLLQILSAHGVKHLFGIPGDAISDVMGAVQRQEEIAVIQVRHEEAGGIVRPNRLKPRKSVN